MKKSEVLAVVVCYNGQDEILATVAALINQVGHVHIVDNASSYKTLTILEKLEKQNNISVTYLKVNSGIGHALNIGVYTAQKMGFEWLLTMDQDSILSENLIDEYCTSIEKNKNLTCLTPTVCVFKNANTFNTSKNNQNTVSYAITSGNLVKLSVFNEIGLYNEKLFIDCVDFDFSLRLRIKGFTINLVPNAKIYHQLGEQHNVPKLFARFYTSHSPLRRYYMYRNWGFMCEKYFLKFPGFITKSSIIHVILLFLIPFYDKNPIKSLANVGRGFKDYFKNQFGPIKI